MVDKGQLEPFMMTYDDTFDFGPFLISCTMFKAVMFRDPVTGATPTIPLSYFLHEQRDTKTHTRNVAMITESVKELESSLYHSW